MSFEHIGKAVRRTFAHALTLAAARKFVSVFGGRLSTAVENIGCAAERARVEDLDQDAREQR